MPTRICRLKAACRALRRRNNTKLLFCLLLLIAGGGMTTDAARALLPDKLRARFPPSLIGPLGSSFTDSLPTSHLLLSDAGVMGRVI